MKMVTPLSSTTSSSGSEIDYEISKLSSRFVFRNPNETDACGCGESVTITPANADALGD